MVPTLDRTRTGSTWRVCTAPTEGPAPFQYELDDDGRIKANPDGTIAVAWWLRNEHGV